MGGQRVYSTPCRRWDSTRLPGYRRNTSTVSAVGMRKFRILSREQTGPKASARILNELRQTNYATPNPLIRNTDSFLFQFARFVFYNTIFFVKIFLKGVFEAETKFAGIRKIPSSRLISVKR